MKIQVLETVCAYCGEVPTSNPSVTLLQRKTALGTTWSIQPIPSHKEETCVPAVGTLKADYHKTIQLRSASRLGRVRVLVREFAYDVRAVWRYGSPFPTFLKLIGSLILCLVVMIPLIYPVFVLGVTYFTFESLVMSFWMDQPQLFTPSAIARRAMNAAFKPCTVTDIWKVREVLTRGILLTHSLATSIDYLCVMQGLIDET